MVVGQMVTEKYIFIGISWLCSFKYKVRDNAVGNASELNSFLDSKKVYLIGTKGATCNKGLESCRPLFISFAMYLHL